MAQKKKINQEVLNEFFDEVEAKKNKSKEEEVKSDLPKQGAGLSKPYQCPSCHKSLSSRKEPCKYCGYKGYIPMGDDEIKRTRIVLFVVLSVIAIAVYILTR